MDGSVDPLAEAAVLDALRTVYDPELGLDVVSMGLVYGIHQDDGLVIVDMTMTTPGCPVSEVLPAQAAEAVAQALGPLGKRSEVRVVWDPPWTPERLSDEAAACLGVPKRSSSRSVGQPVEVRRR